MNKSDWDTLMFMHSDSYIEKLLQGCGFEMLKCLKFFVLGGQEDVEDLCYAYVAQNVPAKAR